jgi:chaperonin GroES
MSVNFKPLADRVLVEPAPAEQKTASGIIIPDTAKEKPVQGEIIAVGTGRILEDGKIQHQTVELGSRGEYQGQTMVAITGLSTGKKILAGVAGPMTVGTVVSTEGAK